jgi:hypothetical protein
MANSIAAALKYLNQKLDKQYKAAAKTAVLDVNPAFVREADIAGTFYIPKLSMPGLGNVTSGVMPTGDVTQTWVAYTYSQDRGRKLVLETVENMEGAMVALANMADEYLRVHVIPELDAYRFETLARNAGTKATGAITTSAEAIAATNAALVAMVDAEVDPENLICFHSAEMGDLLDSAASTEKKARILSRATMVEVPAGRFNADITINAGSSASTGGFSTTGSAINFILMDKNAAFADAKHVSTRLFTPETYQAADAYAWDYRVVHDAWVYSNKTAGVYVHTDATIS